MDLRRFAQENAMGSPRKSIVTQTDGSTTPRRSFKPPTTPVNRPRSGYVEINRSPLLQPSQSETVPFDWDAARGLRDPPYSPLGSASRRARRSDINVLGTPGTPGKRREKAIRKRGFFEKVQAIPSRIAFEISLFPHNVPLPEPRSAACLLGGVLHVMHICVRIAQVRDVPDSNTGWEDMYLEDNGGSWFDWTTLATFVLVIVSALITLVLFTHTKLYHLHSQQNPVSSPNARFVAQPVNSPTFSVRFRSHLCRSVVTFWRFLFNLGVTKGGASADSTRRVQELEVWDASEFELMLFSMYSPMHSLLWMLWNPGNWVMVMFAMVGISVQMRTLITTYEAKLKDRLIIAAEVLNEYDQKFVNPRIHPVRKDACVMTHQSEMVD